MSGFFLIFSSSPESEESSLSSVWAGDGVWDWKPGRWMFRVGVLGGVPLGEVPLGTGSSLSLEEEYLPRCGDWAGYPLGGRWAEPGYSERGAKR